MDDQVPTTPYGWRKSARVAITLAAFVLIVGATAYRTVRVHHVPDPDNPVDTTQFGLCDFHNAVYFPGLAFSRGENPYAKSYAARYPVNREMSPYSPGVLPLCAAFGVLPLRVAEVCWFSLNVLLALWFARLLQRQLGWGNGLEYLFALGTFLLVSRAGQSSQILGQFGMFFAIATAYALQDSDMRPWRSALGIAVATLKPTFGIPLVVLMLCQRRFRVVIAGVSLGGIIALASVAWLVAHNNTEIINSFQASNEAIASDFDVASESAWMRIDLISVVGRLVAFTPSPAIELGAMLLMLVPPAIILWRMNDVPSTETQLSLGDAIIFSAIPVCGYHQAYDALVVLPVVAALCAWRADVWPGLRMVTRLFIVAALLLPVVSYLPTWSVLERLQIRGTLRSVVVSTNAVSLLVANVLLWKEGVLRH